VLNEAVNGAHCGQMTRRADGGREGRRCLRSYMVAQQKRRGRQRSMRKGRGLGIRCP
jgi:hypothetical protein